MNRLLGPYVWTLWKKQKHKTTSKAVVIKKEMKKESFFTFLCLHGFLWSFISIGYFLINGFFPDALGIGFTVSFLSAHMFLFAWLLGLICLPFRWTNNRLFQLVCVGASTFLTLLLLVDLFVFSQYRFHIGLAMLKLFFGPANREIFVFPASMWLLTAVAALSVASLEIGLLLLAKRFPLKTKHFAAGLGVWLFMFVLYNGLYAWGKFMWVPSIIAQRKVLPLAYPISVNRRLEKLGFAAKKDPYQNPKKGYLNYPLAPLVCPHKATENVLIVVIDSWRADMLTPQVMPLLSGWIKKPGMTVFSNHLSGGNGTESGIFSLFYSLPHGYWDDFTSAQLPPVVVSKAWEQGYTPAIFTSAKLTSPAFYRNIFATIPNLRLESKGDTSWQRDINAVTDFEQFIHKQPADKPFFGFVFLDAPHGFSYPPQDNVFTPAKELNYFLLTNNTNPTPYLNRYKNAVHFIDKMVNRLLTTLQQHNLLKNTFIVITGDHGQELNDSHHNFWGHNGNFTDYQTKIPLVVYQNAPTGPTQVDYRTSHYDIAPTIVQRVYHCTNPITDYSIGYSLFDSTPRPFTLFAGYTEKAIRIEDNVFAFDSFGGMQRYDKQMRPISQRLSPNVLKTCLKLFSRFYK